MARPPTVQSATSQPSAAKPSRERIVGDIRNDDHRRWLDRNGYGSDRSVTVTVEASSVSSSVLSLPLAVGGGETMAVGKVGIPVPEGMTTANVAVSWLSDNAPGDWTLRILKRSAGSDLSEVATFTVTTS